MSLTDRPAPARTDLLTTTGAPAAAQVPAQVPAQRGRRQHAPLADPPTASWVRRRGLVLAAGGLVWAVATLAIGLNEESPVIGRVSEAAGLAFQVGVFALLRVMWATRATGTSRLARGMLAVEHVLLGVATVSTVLTTVFFTTHPTWLVVVDMFWPLSMLGMLVIAVKVAVVGRWRGALRFVPLWAEAYFPLVMTAIALFGTGAIDAASATVVLTGYTALGLLVAARPHLTGARD
ncbi:hypothetical protein FHN55_06435 [Streptomyces sp. NP160]|uniref:hypothetical protein n=1 Tax=Streptomyces sp. NP160 TaxID=2586637 RepID=UPI00111B0D93|nr:hypothetical protein [Streptomyces sp. NP160]TNM68445.1 hypothetical protein FHN55_06435 [Streptomyces sp. NP160]